jgi:hypothetical protein
MMTRLLSVVAALITLVASAEYTNASSYSPPKRIHISAETEIVLFERLVIPRSQGACILGPGPFDFGEFHFLIQPESVAAEVSLDPFDNAPIFQSEMTLRPQSSNQALERTADRREEQLRVER